MITALPPAPSPTDSVAVFDPKAFALLAALPTFVTEANALGASVDAVAAATQITADLVSSLLLSMALPSYAGTSTTSLAIGTGSKSITTQTGKAWVAGQMVIVDNGAGAFMKGSVTSYSGSALVVNVTSVVGSGTFASWSIGLTYSALAASGNNTDIVSLDGVLVGKGAGGFATNTRYGKGALVSNISGQGNLSMGVNAMAASTSSWWTVAVGNDTCGSGEGVGNTAVGDRAMSSLAYGYSGNIAIGGRGRSGSYSPVFDITTQNDRVSVGSTLVTNAYIQVAWTVVSDARDKTNFAPVPHGLSFVNALKPTAYQFKVSRDDDTPNGHVRYGFKAQEVLALEGDNPVIIDNEDPEKLRMVDQHLIAVLVKAMQELSATVNAQAARIEALEARL